MTGLVLVGSQGAIDLLSIPSVPGQGRKADWDRHCGKFVVQK